MPKNEFICIECPKGCALSAHVNDLGKVTGVEGNLCPRGKEYAKQEVENPIRVLTTTIAAKGLFQARVPVKTNIPIPKNKLEEVAHLCLALVVDKPISCGDVIIEDIANTGASIIATRSISGKEKSLRLFGHGAW